MKIVERLEALTLASALALPERIQRVLAGAPVVLDGQTLDTGTQLILRLQRLTREPVAETLQIPEGRVVINRQSRLVGGSQPIGSVRDETIAGLPARFYEPTDAEGAGPLLAFFHGGGWIYGDLDSHDASCRFLAERAGVRVIAVDYRLAPEARFPAAYDDSVRAFAEILERADEWDVDRDRIGVGGDSAGGNLAAAVAIEAARQGWPCAFQLLVYPLTDMGAITKSRQLFAEGFYLSQGFIDLATESYAPDPAVWSDPRLSPLYADLPAGLAPALVVTAGFDPLRDEGEEYVEKLDAAGVEVQHVRYPTLIHSFFNMVGVGGAPRKAVGEIADALRKGLAH